VLVIEVVVIEPIVEMHLRGAVTPKVIAIRGAHLRRGTNHNRRDARQRDPLSHRFFREHTRYLTHLTL